jgi:dihydroorotate dehydrogenase
MWQLLARLARQLPAEAAHQLAVETLRWQLGPRPAIDAGLIDLAVTLGGITFPNPIGLAAGFDKNAACYHGALRLGFGHVEVGTITPLPQAGNPKPRVFRLAEDRAVFNRYGFNGKGMAAAAQNLRRRQLDVGVVGVNVGANKTSKDPIADYRHAVAALAGLADYITLNISSPNTPGLRDLQTAQHLQSLLSAARAGLDDAKVTRPLFLKIAPDLHDQDLAAIVETAVSSGVCAIIATNTTIARPSGLASHHAGETGGLSGAPLFAPATDILARVVTHAKGRLGVVGVGGVASGWQAYAKILVGADLVQLYTGLALNGPELPAQILQELVTLMQADGVNNLADAKGHIPHATKAIQHAIRLSQISATQPAKT